MCVIWWGVVGLVGMVFVKDVVFVASADHDDAEAGGYVEVDADVNPVGVLDLGVGPVAVPVEWVVDSCIFEVRELAFDVTGN